MRANKKGEFGYIRREKKRRFIVTAALFALPLTVFFFAWVKLGSRETVWTVASIVGCLPGCRSLVNLIMILRCHGMDPEAYERIRAHQGQLCMAYEMYMTFYEKSCHVDAAAVCGKNVVLYSSDPGADPRYMSSHAEEILKNNGCAADVKMLTNEKAFLDRLDTLNTNFESLEGAVKEREDERYPGFTRDEVRRAVLLRLCL